MPDYSHRNFHFHILEQFDDFARSIRLQFRSSTTPARSTQPPEPPKAHADSPSPLVYRKMKFLRKTQYRSPSSDLCSSGTTENYIHATKLRLDSQLEEICSRSIPNITNVQKKALKKFKKSLNQVTIKPADKNLGVVILNAEDYVIECTTHLANTQIYRLAETFPSNDLQNLITNVLISFKPPLHNYDKKLYKYLQPTSQHRTPQFYGIPKLHKKYTRIPPIRPIVSHTNSLLSHTAIFIDHVLQPLAQCYPDYLHNSTTLIRQLEHLSVPDDAILLSIDVNSLYPSIPQTECLEIIYEEMCSHQDLLMFDPNLIIRLLHANVNYNYFEFAGLTFQQTKGTAMGAAFSPTVANIFMSVIIRRFLSAQNDKPTLLKRYIDDIFVIWPNETNLTQFTSDLNSFHS